MTRRDFGTDCRWAGAAVVALAVWCSGAATAQDGAAVAEPTAEAALSPEESRARALEVIARSIEAMGGRDAIAAVTSRVERGTLAIEGQAGMSGTIISKTHESGLFDLVVTIPNVFEQRVGSDGKHGWMIDPFSGVQLMSEEMLEEQVRTAGLQAPLRYEAIYETIEYVGSGSFKGEPVDSVRLATAGGDEQIQHFSVSSGHQIGMVGVTETPFGPTKVTVAYSEFKPFGDLMLATITRLETGAGNQIVTLTGVEFNSVEADSFETPPEVVKLLERTEANKKPDDDGG